MVFIRRPKMLPSCNPRSRDSWRRIFGRRHTAHAAWRCIAAIKLKLPCGRGESCRDARKKAFLSLRELGRAACGFEAVLFALFHAWVAREEARFLK